MKFFTKLQTPVQVAIIGGFFVVLAGVIAGLFQLYIALLPNGDLPTGNRHQKYAALSLGHDILLWSAIMRVADRELSDENKTFIIVTQSNIKGHLLMVDVELDFPPDPLPSHEELKFTFLKYDEEIKSKLSKLGEDMLKYYEFGFIVGTVQIMLVATLAGENQDESAKNAILDFSGQIIEQARDIGASSKSISTLISAKDILDSKISKVSAKKANNLYHTAFNNIRSHYAK